jgi:cell division protein FtsI/penicillin-binding protein 2
MNTPITRLYVVFLLLFAVLVVGTSWNTVFRADDLRNQPKNRRQLLEQQRIRRGVIRDDGRELLARSIRQGDGTYTRTYPKGDLFPHAVGYSYTRYGRAGLEQARNDALSGTTNELGTIFDRLSGGQPEGDDLLTTLDPAAQRIALQGLNGRKGAVVALDPQTGAIKVMASFPGYNPNDIAKPGAFTRLNRDPDAPLLNRATQAGYPPGSTFKVVTTAALLRAGFSPSSSVPCPQTITVDGRSFHNFEGESGASSTFDEDFAISCNTAFISLANRLAADALEKTALDYGLGRALHLGVGVAASHVPPGQGAVARAATMIGQDRITATPLAMAGVAATVAAGRWHAPRLLASDPASSGPAIGGGELGTLRGLMRGVVTHGTGTALASVPGDVGGKTGTAEFGSGDPPPTHAWFIAYRGDVAVAVLVERGRSGGSVAAPIAARFLAALP